MHAIAGLLRITTISFALLVPLPLGSNTVDQAQSSTIQQLSARHVFDAKVAIGEMLNFGKSKYGERRIIPITGGTFKGSGIEGLVLPGGADWQLTRPDGDVELYARYTLKTSDGFLIQVQNRVLMHIPRNEGKKEPYVRSVIDFEAPSASPYDWLNHAIFLGTLTVPPSISKENPYVIVSVYQLQ